MKYYIIAGEASGDLHGSNLMKAIFAHDNAARIRFWGGDAMQSVGGECVRHIRDLAIMGFIEVLRHFRRVIGNIAFCKRDIIQFNPDAIIYIDYPGFNLRIANYAHNHGYKNFYYISPQLWAWKKNRIKQMRKSLDYLFCILPFEEEFYRNNSFSQAVYLGHPLLDAIDNNQLDSKSENNSLIALLPGSRKQELAHTMPTMVAFAARHPECRFAVAGMTLLGKHVYEKYIGNISNIEVIYDNTYQLFTQSRLAIVCSGTATLEAALFNVPQVVCYKANPISIAIARKLVGRRVRFISLVNLIADRAVVKELLQNDFNITNLEQEYTLLTQDESYRNSMLDGYADVRNILGNKGASDRVATQIIKAINS